MSLNIFDVDKLLADCTFSDLKRIRRRDFEEIFL
jgi:hypothetical protein